MLRGDRVRKHAALEAINGSLTGINVETQRAKHAQRKSQNVNTQRAEHAQKQLSYVSPQWSKLFLIVTMKSSIPPKAEIKLKILKSSELL